MSTVYDETTNEWNFTIDSPREGSFFWDIKENGTSVYSAITLAGANETHDQAYERAVTSMTKAHRDLLDLRVRVARGEKIGLVGTRGRRNSRS
jgi:hypothetical protein